MIRSLFLILMVISATFAIRVNDSLVSADLSFTSNYNQPVGLSNGNVACLEAFDDTLKFSKFNSSGVLQCAIKTKVDFSGDNLVKSVTMEGAELYNSVVYVVGTMLNAVSISGTDTTWRRKVYLIKFSEDGIQQGSTLAPSSDSDSSKAGYMDITDDGTILVLGEVNNKVGVVKFSSSSFLASHQISLLGNSYTTTNYYGIEAASNFSSTDKYVTMFHTGTNFYAPEVDATTGAVLTNLEHEQSIGYSGRPSLGLIRGGTGDTIIISYVPSGILGKLTVRKSTTKLGSSWNGTTGQDQSKDLVAPPDDHRIYLTDYVDGMFSIWGYISKSGVNRVYVAYGSHSSLDTSCWFGLAPFGHLTLNHGVNRNSDSTYALYSSTGKVRVFGEAASPTLLVTSISNTEITNSVDISWSATHAHGIASNTVEYSIDGGSSFTSISSPSSGMSWTPSDTGDYIIKVTATSNYNTDSSYSISFSVSDNTDPSVSISTSDATKAQGASVSVSWTDSDNWGVYSREGFINGTSQGSQTSPWSMTLSNTTGAYRCSVLVEDSSGRTASDVVIFTVEDQIDPSISVSTSDATTKLGASKTVEWSDSDLSGISSREGFLNGTSQGAVTSPWSITLPSTAGTYVYKVTVTDGASRINSDSVTFTVVDSTDPTVESLSVPGTILPGNTAMTLTWSSSDNVGIISRTVYYSLDDGNTWVQLGTPSSDETSWNPDTNANKAKIKVVVTDDQGNTSEAISSAFTIVGTPSFSSASTGAINGGTSFAYKMTYSIPGSPDTSNLSVIQKPDWLSVDNDSIKGTAPNEDRTDTIKAVLTSGGLSDTLTLIVTVSAVAEETSEEETSEETTSEETTSEENATGIRPFIPRPVPFGMDIHQGALRIGLDKAGLARIRVMDASGRHVFSEARNRTPGYHRIGFNGATRFYIVELRHEGRVLLRRYTRP